MNQKLGITTMNRPLHVESSLNKATKREINEKIAYLGIVTVAQDGLVLEVFFVVLELSFDVGKYCVELIVLFTLCFV